MKKTMMLALALAGAQAALAGNWMLDVRKMRFEDPNGTTNYPWMASHDRKIKITGTLLIGRDGLPLAHPPGGTDWRHVLRNAGGINAVVFGSETGPCFKPDCYIQSLYAGFPGCGNITSVTSRVTEPMAWNKTERWSEGLPCVLFQHCGKLQTLELAGFLTSAAGLPKLKSGQCRVVVPANHPNWVAFVVTPGNLKAWAKLTDAARAAYWKGRPAGAEKTECAPYGMTEKGNSIAMPEGYWIVPRERYAFTVDLVDAASSPRQDGAVGAARRGEDAASTRGWSLYALKPAPTADGTYAAGTEVTATLKGPEGQEKTLAFAMACDRGLAADLASVLAEDAAKAKRGKFVISVDPSAKPIKDVSKSPCFPDLGLAGENTAPGIFNDPYLAYVKNREATARAYREAGVWLVRPCGELDDFKGVAKHPGQDWVIDKNGRCQWLHPKYHWSFHKEYGLRSIVCLNIWNDDPPAVSNLVAYLDWLSSSGYTEQVAAFEMCNEAFYGKDPEGFARYWHNLLPIVKKYFPKTPIGVPLAEYCAGDPDIAAVKARLLGKTDLGGDYFTANNLNKWSARTVVALSNDWQYISHVIYHVYGAAGAYGCSMTGFGRFRNFAKLFPQVKDKRWLITEWRPWSDGSEQLMRSFREAIWSGMYIQTSFWQPELDGFTLHELNSIGGVFYASANGKWNQYYDSWENGRDLRAVGYTTPSKGEVGRGDLRYERSGMGEVFRLFNQAVITHPRIMDYGSRFYGRHGGTYASADYDGGNYKAKADCVWTALLNGSPSSMCLMFANGTDDELKVPVRLRGYRLLSKSHRFVTMPDERYLNMRDVLGEEKMWKTVSYESISDGRLDAPQEVIVPPRSVGTVMIGLRRWDEWHAVSYGRPMVQRTIDAARAAKGAKPSVECCAVERGQVCKILPDGYPNHPEVKANLPARKWAEKIGKDKKLDAAALAEAKKAGYYVVDNGSDRAWLFKATDIPESAATKLRDQLQEMCGF